MLGSHELNKLVALQEIIITRKSKNTFINYGFFLFLLLSEFL